MATRVALFHYRGNEAQGRRRLVQRVLDMDPYCGYGPCQHFHNLPPFLQKVRRGDSFELHCWYDNQDRKVVHYGVSNGDEMCGPLVMYAPHDPSANDGGNMAYASGDGRRLKAPAGAGADPKKA